MDVTERMRLVRMIDKMEEHRHFSKKIGMYNVSAQGGKNMIITTTTSVEGKNIVEYKGIVFGEVISGVNFLRDLAASFSNFFGGRSGSYEEELIQARQNAIREMEERAISMGANAVVGVDIDYEVLGADNGMLMVTASGTAVVTD